MDNEEKTINIVNENYKRMQKLLNEEYNNGLKHLDEREYGEEPLSYGIYEKQPLKKEEKSLKTEVRRKLVKRAMILVMTFGIGVAGIVQYDFSNSGLENPNVSNFDNLQIDEQKLNEYESEEHGTTYQDFIDYAKETGAPITQDSYEDFQELTKRGAR